MRKTALLVAALILAASPALAQQSNARGKNTAIAATVLPVAGLAAISTTQTHLWTTIGSQTWNFPWTNSRFFLSPLGPNGGVTQGVHATGQYVHNVINPHYFNETLSLSPNAVHTPASGTHSTSAQYKQHHQSSSKKMVGKFAVGCIFGSALMTIIAANAKATAMGNPPRWRSQAEHEAIVRSGYEKQFELTSEEASTAMALCGLGSFYVMSQPVPAPVAMRRR